MADITKTVEIIFNAVDNASSGISSAVGGLGAFGEKVEAIASPLAGIGDSILKVDTALATMAAGGLVLAVKSAGEFSDSFAEINTLAGTTGASMEQFKADILDYASGSTQSIESINTAVYNAISMGVKYEDSLKVVSTAEKLAVAGKAELNSTLELLQGTMNAYGADVDQAGRYSDAFFTIVKDGKTTVPELAASLANVSGIAASAGIDIETLGAALAAVTAAGVPTGEAITGIKAAISNIIKPSSEAEKAAAALGIQFNASELKAKGFDGVLREVYEATGGNVEQMGKFFGSVEGLNTALVLGADKSGTFGKAMEDMKNKTGATEAAFKEMSQNLGLSMQNLVNNFKVLLIETGTPLLGEFGETVSALANVLKGVKLSIDAGAFNPLFDALNDLQNEIQDFLNGVAKAFPEAMEKIDFSDLIKALKNLGGEFGEMWGNLDLTNADDLAVAIQWVVDSITSLINVTSGIVEAWTPFVKGIVNSISGFNQLDAATQQSSGNILGVAQAIVKLGAEFAAALILMGNNVNTIKGTFQVLIGAVEVAWNSLQTAFDALMLFVIDVVDTILAAAELVTFGDVNEAIKENRAELKLWGEAVKDHMLKNSQETQDGLNKMGEGFSDIAGNAEEAKGEVKAVGEEVKALPTNYTLDMALNESGLSLEQFWDVFEKLPEEKKIAIKTMVESGNALDAVAFIAQEIDAKLPDEKKVEVKTEADKAAIEKVDKTIKEKIPDKQTMEIEAKIDIANIEAEATKVKAAFESMSKLGVAQIEADAEKYVAALESISSMAGSVADILGGLFDLWGDAKTIGDKWQIEEWIDDQLDIQKQQLELQKKLIDEQIKYYQERTQKLQSGDAMIEIKSDGLEPELEAFMWKILEKVQVRVNEEMSEYLLGLNPSGA